MNVQKIKEQIRQKGNAVEEAQPKIQEEIEESEEDKNWKNPEYDFITDFEFGEGGHGDEILESLKRDDIDYNSKKSMSQFREFFYDLVSAYEKYENNL